MRHIFPLGENFRYKKVGSMHASHVKTNTSSQSQLQILSSRKQSRMIGSMLSSTMESNHPLGGFRGAVERKSETS
jgi:hypothetical protein